MNKNEILKTMKDFYGNNNLKFPEHMDINVGENGEKTICSITLDPELVRKKNMQEDSNAFEGWSIAVYIALKEQYKNITVMLCLKNSSDTDSDKTGSHWIRFLYRAGHFCEQYLWFCLDKELADQMEIAAEIFKNHTGQYINNVPNHEAGIKADRDKENRLEAYLAEGTRLKEAIGDKMIFDGEEVYRQLPVGLFRDSVKDSNKVFPSNKSAIDLWSCKDDTFYAVELKTLNSKMGIITEIFFYTNYMHDLLVRRTFALNQKISKIDRGYANLLNHAFHNINGIMLADQYHPILKNRTDEVLGVMNDNGSVNIRYYKIDYKEKISTCVE